MNKLFVTISLLFALTSCLKEESLEPNMEATQLAQQTGSGNSGGGNTSGEFFNFTLNGAAESHNNPSHISQFNSYVITSRNDGQAAVSLSFNVTSAPDTISFSGFSNASLAYTIPNQQNPTSPTTYRAEDGELIITKADSITVEGVFDNVLAKNSNDSTDIITFTNGSFKILK